MITLLLLYAEDSLKVKYQWDKVCASGILLALRFLEGV